ncbi:MAG: hypothetical protein IRZ31_03365 [Thermogemmatispora sp.]|uniref:hypothetical protein n=1 Tax=Thermogemmatispora sp. TaxID=1968838 RepID=UPI00260C9130|nr:hypothetical protein [Thermogemmatispora sp.]MBX5455916.1 hypothetical protein [Thermogemmatispora sp.]
MKKAERKRSPLLATLGDLNRPLRVRPVRLWGREWWAIAPEDTWPGMVMDLRRLGFEATAWGEEVLVRESAPAYEPQLEGPAAPEGLRAFPTMRPTIRVWKESRPARYSDWGRVVSAEESEEVDEEFEPEDLEVPLYSVDSEEEVEETGSLEAEGESESQESKPE